MFASVVLCLEYILDQGYCNKQGAVVRHPLFASVLLCLEYSFKEGYCNKQGAVVRLCSTITRVHLYLELLSVALVYERIVNVCLSVCFMILNRQ